MVKGQLAPAMLAGTLPLVRRPPLVHLVPAGHAAPAMLAGTLLVVRRPPIVQLATALNADTAQRVDTPLLVQRSAQLVRAPLTLRPLVSPLASIVQLAMLGPRARALPVQQARFLHRQALLRALLVQQAPFLNSAVLLLALAVHLATTAPPGNPFVKSVL